MSPASADAASASGASKKKHNKKKGKASKAKEDAASVDVPPNETEAEADAGAEADGEVEGGDIAAGEDKHETSEPVAQVDELRSQLATIQTAHETEVAQLKEEVEEATAAKEQAEEEYEVLRDRVEKIKSTVGERFQHNRAELEQANERIADLEAQNDQLRSQAESAEKRAQSLEDELQETNRELASLRSRNNLSAENWNKEKDDLLAAAQHLREELQSTTNAMGEWEVIAMEERALKDTYADKMVNLEEQLDQLNEAYLSVSNVKDSQDQSIDNLQRALAELQDTRRRELRDMVETHEEQIKALKAAVREADTKLTEALAEKETLSKELARTAPYEKEVNEKNLLIGKLRHEAIVLNEHLTKALRYLKKTKPQDQVDRQIVTNQLVHFLSLDRSDPKRFQILQVMASYLQFTDEEREQAGLARPGTSTNNLRLPASPFARTPSSPSLHSDFFTDPTAAGATTGPSSKETLAELWANFLERSAEEGVGTGGGKMRQDSVSSAGTRPDARS
ncbi:hypothetical protein TD95_001056 [Thielaviopsis punctulata]|uniref:GRIP domain-containing protein n=1 Tax=Thielaviopsis punctulata TaxID=72032 RepID=A0A0F4ZAS7_9PEZI|nr:hypothetical protein TD95_001066 [Thielaviopsis punctulata]KKA26958.1 hypothetical protein TD95_001056 [Thielaviopsis punctulata]